MDASNSIFSWPPCYHNFQNPFISPRFWNGYIIFSIIISACANLTTKTSNLEFRLRYFLLILAKSRLCSVHLFPVVQLIIGLIIPLIIIIISIAMLANNPAGPRATTTIALLCLWYVLYSNTLRKLRALGCVHIKTSALIFTLIFLERASILTSFNKRI